VGHPINSLTAVLGKTRLQGGWSAAVFYPFGHPTPNAYAFPSDEFLTSDIFGFLLGCFFFFAFWQLFL
jgi:hypothetical protein